MIEKYPRFSSPSFDQRALLHSRFQNLSDGISEFTFAGIYLFRHVHDYAISDLGDGLIAISGGREEPFFMLPFGLPAVGANDYSPLLDDLFSQFRSMKCVPASMTGSLSRLGYRVWEDRDNSDYLYRRADLATMSGRKRHSQKNLINVFMRNNECVLQPLTRERVRDALGVLKAWRDQQDTPGDYVAAQEALEQMEPLQLCGSVFYVEDEPVAYTLGEELAQGRSFVIHFEKAVVTPRYKGIYQYVTQSFAAWLPEKYETINREQDLGDPGLRQAKESYKPVGFVEKYRASR
jgi:uncharacterized protein